MTGYVVYFTTGQSGDRKKEKYPNKVEIRVDQDEYKDDPNLIVQFTITDLYPTQNYAFVVTAFDDQDPRNESDTSNEASTDNVAPPAVPDLTSSHPTARDTDGKKLRFGDSALLMELVEETGKRKGFGDLLAEGSFRMAEWVGKDSANLLYCFKRVEVAGHSARALKGMSLGYATATRGGSHHDARPTLQYAGEFDRTKDQIAPSFAFRTQNFTDTDDSLTQCRFASERGFGGVINDNYARMINSVGRAGI